VFYDGVKNEPRVNHPEGVAVHPDGSVWCGTGTGDILRIEPDGKSAELIATTHGFVLGLDFDEEGNLYACDMKHCDVFRVSAKTRKIDRFRHRLPHSQRSGGRRSAWRALSSPTVSTRRPGPDLPFDLATARGLWYEEPLAFANGLALKQPTARRCSWSNPGRQRTSTTGTLGMRKPVANRRSFASWPIPKHVAVLHVAGVEVALFIEVETQDEAMRGGNELGALAVGLDAQNVAGACAAHTLPSGCTATPSGWFTRGSFFTPS